MDRDITPNKKFNPVEDIAAICKKHKRQWKVCIECLKMIITFGDDLVMDDPGQYDLDKYQISIVYDQYFGCGMLDYETCAKMLEVYSDVDSEFKGMSFEELETAYEIMKYLNSHNKEIDKWLDDNFPYEYEDEDGEN